ncbi:MAG: hypothetical protein QOG90_762 [Actinomycetota bacterium]
MSRNSQRMLRHRGLAVLGAVGILATYVGVLPAHAGVPFTSPDAKFSGSAVGSAVHTDALNSGSTRVANADISLASAAVNSKGLTAAATNENGRQINPNLGTSKFSYGRGAGVEVGLVADPGTDGQIILAGKSEGSAPCTVPPSAADSCTPPNWHNSQQVGPVNAAPVAYASVAQGTSDAKWNTETCILGDDISRGLGYTADAQLVDTGSGNAPDLNAPLLSVDAPAGRRNVVQTVSREYFSPNSAQAFGLNSQVEQTLAPITLFRGTDTELTIEVAGEWVLDTFASGVPGQSKVSYHPQNTDGTPVTPTTPLVRIIQGGAVTNILTTQDIFGDTGLDQINIPGVADIAIGEDPRAIGGDASTSPAIAADGTSVSAAIDVVRVKLLDGSLADIRVGHMEAKAAVPPGGINCPIPVTKSTGGLTTIDANSAPGGLFVTTITVKNAFACPLENVSLTDDIHRKTGDLTFEIADTDARNDPKKGAGANFSKQSSTQSTASYPNLGTIPVGGTKVVNVVTHVIGGGGVIEDIATAKGDLHCGPGSAIGEARFSLNGSFTLARTATRVLARTGGSEDLALAVGAVALAAIAIRRVVRGRNATA